MAIRIGIDARHAAGHLGGRRRVVRELLRAFGARGDDVRFRLYVRHRWAQDLDERFAWRVVAGSPLAWHRRVARAVDDECDVFLADSYLTPPLISRPAVVLVHDLFAFDRSSSPPLRSSLVERVSLPLTVRRARRFVAPSEGTAARLAERHPSAAGRTTVVNWGVTRLGAAATNGYPPMVLTVGLDPRKNVERLAGAFASLPAAVRDGHALVAVGHGGRRTGPARAAVQTLGERGIVLDSVGDEELSALYRSCTVFCYPSLGEGFGLPLVEAMAAGAAVVASSRPSLPEIGGDAVQYVDPLDERALADAVAALLRSPERRAELGRRARARAERFTWSAAAEAVLGELRQAAG